MVCSFPGLSQQFFPFSVDQDQLAGAPDLSSLNHPLAAGDRLQVCGEHFCRSGDGSRVQLFGVNLAFGANFPDQADAARIAKRLRRFGINLVRLHHMDSSPDRNPSDARSLLTTGPYPTLNPVSVARLRNFLTALKAEGIYADLNLHVGYTFRPDVDHVPALENFPKQSKPLQTFYPRMVDLQCEYAHKVIDALKLKDDPVLGVVEINNESSLIYAWQSNQFDPYVTGEYAQALRTQWNAYLKQRYGTTAKLREAWGGGNNDGPELLGNNWVMEAHSPTTATSQKTADALVVRLAHAGGSMIAKQVGFSIEKGQRYIAEVEVRADLPNGVSRTLHADIKRDVSPWDSAASKTVQVTNQWQKIRLAVQQSPVAFDKNGRFGLELQAFGADTPVYVRNWSLHSTAGRGLSANEAIEAGTVALVDNDAATTARIDDYLRFLTGVDRNFLDRMQAVVRETAGPSVPVAGTQMGYGGLMNLDSHADLSYQDNHFYIDHYNFPNTQWDGHDWRQKNASGVGTGMTELSRMAMVRQAGRPYTVSEFNQPWPNMQANEIDPVTAAFGAFQGWDALMHFAYAHASDWETAQPNGFNLNGDFSKLVLLSQSAFLFRGAIHSGREPIDIPVSAQLRLQSLREKQNWNVAKLLASASGVEPGDLFVHPVRVVKDGPPSAASPKHAAAPYQADSGELTYDPDGKLFLIHAQQAAGVLGYAGNRAVKSGPMEVRLAAGARGFATILLTSLDQKPLSDSRHLLLSTPGYTVRTNQKIINYQGQPGWWTLEPAPGSGKPSGDMNRGETPVLMERVESTIRLTTSAKTIHVYPLSGTGARLAPLSGKDVQPSEGGFVLHLQAEGQALSPWFEIALDTM
jgi:hypothetical protein